jgi:cyclophilin family peptidyl-prolyl cis-trans isomerase
MTRTRRAAAGLLAILAVSTVLWAAPATQPAELKAPQRAAPKTARTLPAKPAAPSAADAPAVPATLPIVMGPLAQRLEAELRVWQPVYQVGQPVWVEFTLRNLTGDVLPLQVPNALVAEVGPPAMGLPLPHVFSGPGFTALQITRQSDQSEGLPVVRKPGGPVAPVILAPYGSLGVHVDAAKWYPMLRQPGEYRLQWKPYDGLVTSNAVTVKIATFKDAIIRTEFGNMRIRLLYDKAPKTVENFLELAQKNFYDSTTFHRFMPGFVLQGGSPTGDDTGVRPDGIRLKAEFNNTPFDRGTVAMARSQDDPDSGSCQFFICLSRQPQLDGQYTAFGQLVGNESFETLSKIEQVEVTRGPFGEKSQPVKPIRIQSVILENAPRPPMKIQPLGGPGAGAGLASN